MRQVYGRVERMINVCEDQDLKRSKAGSSRFRDNCREITKCAVIMNATNSHASVIALFSINHGYGYTKLAPQTVKNTSTASFNICTYHSS